MMGDTKGDIHQVRGTSVARTLRMLRGGEIAACCLALLPHAGAVALMLMTETTAVGMAVFPLSGSCSTACG